jgi:long-subunit fatty acid transport protein
MNAVKRFWPAARHIYLWGCGAGCVVGSLARRASRAHSLKHGGLLAAVAAIATVLCGPALYAQLAPPNITVTPKPVGSGARALGESAFIAVADDATAASWNPAGLVQLERPEASFVGAWTFDVDHFGSSSRDIRLGRTEWDQPEVNFMSFALPFTVAGKDVVASVNYHQVYDFGLNLKFNQAVRGPGTLLPLRLGVKSEGAVAATSLAAGISLTPSLMLGAALNFYGNRLGGTDAWQVKTRASGHGLLGGLPATVGFANTETFDNFHAVNATVGLLWDAWAKNDQSLTFGGVVHTPFTADVDRRTDTTTVLNGAVNRLKTDENMKINFPLSVGGGVNYRMSDAWSIASDVQWTDWSEFEQRDSSGRRSSPIGGGPPGHIADTVAVRLGTEYLIFLKNSVLALRGGVFREERPALGNAMGVYGYSLGAGWSTKRYSVDFAYQFRWGDDASGRNLGLDRATRYRIEEHMLVASLIVYF